MGISMRPSLLAECLMRMSVSSSVPTRVFVTRSPTVVFLLSFNLVKPNMHIKDVGNLVSDVADSYGYYPDRNYCGHGIGKMFHCNPNVPHYRSRHAAIDQMQITTERDACDLEWCSQSSL